MVQQSKKQSNDVENHKIVAIALPKSGNAIVVCFLD